MATAKARPTGAAGTSTNKQKGKGGRSAPPNGGDSSTGRSTPTNVSNSSPAPVSSGSSKPDKAMYETEQGKFKTEIDALQGKLAALKSKISPASASGTGNNRRSELRAELDAIRGQQANSKMSRSKILEKLKAVQEEIQRQVKALQLAKSKAPFKSVEEVDARIKQLETQVESGNMKLADEKRALQDINQARRNRRLVENFQADHNAIEANRQIAEELRKQLDDPELKAASEKFEAIKTELDELKKEEEILHNSRSKLFEERDQLQAQVNELYGQKRASTQQFKDANDLYWTKVNEERARRAEKARAQRAAEEAQKKLEQAERLREEAAVPAYQPQIEDCQTLIEFFSGKSSGNASLATSPTSEKAEVAGIPKLEIRKVDAPDGLVAVKKREEEAYFVGGKGKKGKKGGTKQDPAVDTNPGASSTTARLNIPFPTLSALLSLSIPPPTSSTDIPRVIGDLKTKKTWFEANQAHVTAENLAKAEANIARLAGNKPDSKTDAAAQEPQSKPLNGSAEPTSNPAALASEEPAKE